MTWDNQGVTIADPEQVVLESEPYRRLSYTWHTVTPEFGQAVGFSEDLSGQLAAESRSKVTFELEPAGSLVKLTVVHDGFGPDSVMAGMVSQGWPQVIASLKTLLETGQPLPA
jgi:uncharacterized protein YndB with AHSA1/START domain